MTAKEYLKQAYRIDRRIKVKVKHLEALRDTATRISAVLSDMPRNPNGRRSKVDEAVAKIVDLEKEIDSDIGKLMDMKREIIESIKAVDDVQSQMVLELRYLCFFSWEDIAAELNCTVRNIHKLHGKALELVRVTEQDESRFLPNK